MLVYSLGSWQDGYGKFPDALFSLGPCRWHMPWTTNLTTPKKCTIWSIVHSISGTLVYSLAVFFWFLSGTNPLRIAFCSVFRCCNPSNKRLERLEQGWFRAWCLHHFLEYIYIYLFTYLFIIYGLMFVYTVYIYIWYVDIRLKDTNYNTSVALRLLKILRSLRIATNRLLIQSRYKVNRSRRHGVS